MENLILAELAKGGKLQNTHINFLDEDEAPAGFTFGKALGCKNWSIDRRQANINDINRELRKVKVSAIITQRQTANSLPFVDATGYQLFVEFV